MAGAVRGRVIVLFIFLAPLIGMASGYLMITPCTWLFRRLDAAARGQGVPPRPAAVGGAVQPGPRRQRRPEDDGHHLRAADRRQPGGEFATPGQVPTEVVLACHTAMGLGTLFGGWRIVKTMGQRIIRLRPVDGFCAEAGAAATLVLTIFGGVPVSTTHTITGAIVGVGSCKRLERGALGGGRAGRLGLGSDHPRHGLVAAVCWWLLAPLAGLLAGSP